jgi:hypothetical protein
VLLHAQLGQALLADAFALLLLLLERAVVRGLARALHGTYDTLQSDI